MKKILITGDSFAANWQTKYNTIGWPNLMSQQYQVINLAQAGCGEYKIYKQLVSQTLSNFDIVLISHTSPYRIYCSSHPVHKNDPLHANSDFIYSDVVENVDKRSDLANIKYYFENFFDMDHAKFIHRLICKEIVNLTQNVSVIHLSFFDYRDLFEFNNFLSFYDIFENHRGSVNHLNKMGNKIVYEKLIEVLENENVAN